MNFSSELIYQPACIAGLNRFTPINRIGIYAVINVSLANYIGDCQVLNASINCHKDGIYQDQDKGQLLGEINDFFEVDEDRHIHEFMLTTLTFEEMLTSCYFMATQILANCNIKQGSEAAKKAILDTNNARKDMFKNIVEMENITSSTADCEDELFYLALVMKEQLELLFTYVMRFKGYKDSLEHNLKIDYEFAYVELESTINNAFTRVGLDGSICINKVVQMANIFALNGRVLCQDVIIYLLDNINTSVCVKGAN